MGSYEGSHLAGRPALHPSTRLATFATDAAPAAACRWPCRQAERRSDIKEVLQHWGYQRTVDMSPFEAEGQYFEGTVRPPEVAVLLVYCFYTVYC